MALVGGQLSKRTEVGWAETMGTLDTRFNNTNVARSCKKKAMDQGMDGGRARRCIGCRGRRQD